MAIIWVPWLLVIQTENWSATASFSDPLLMLSAIPVSCPNVSLSMKMSGEQRKAGRRQRARRRFACRLYPSHGLLRLITSRSPLPCKKRSAWGGGCCHTLLKLSSLRHYHRVWMVTSAFLRAEMMLESYAEVDPKQFTTRDTPYQLVHYSTVPNNKKTPQTCKLTYNTLWQQCLSYIRTSSSSA